MSEPKEHEPVKLISSIFSADRKLLNSTIMKLTSRFGDPDYISEILPFDFTSYYEKEMGQSLMRRFITFRTLIRPEMLPEIKHATNKIEEELSHDGKRQVNIDPGYICKAHLLLATGKAYTHRPYLRSGIYADVTLIYRNNCFESLEWTYPDYSGEKIRGMMNVTRKRYLEQLKRLRKMN